MSTSPGPVFTFWEPRDHRIPYLELCRRSWARHLPGDSLVTLDYANMDEHIAPGTLDLGELRRLPLPMQKDAVSVALLAEHGGVFMDADTLMFRDLSPILAALERTEAIMFGTHMGFLAARPEAELLRILLAAIQERLARIAAGRESPDELSWDYLANAPLAESMDAIIRGALLIGAPLNRRAPPPGTTSPRAGRRRARAGTPAQSRSGLRDFFLRRRRSLAFRTVFRSKLTMLNTAKSGFIPEARRYPPRRFDPVSAYRSYWFETDGDVQDVLCANPVVVGLHNTWTPGWYKELPERAVLEHRCRLSRTLRFLLAD